MCADYLAIHGKFHVSGFSPDGDSIRFEADNPAVWQDPRFAWRTASARNAAKKQLRLEAIDALETHYEGMHQPRAFGLGALEFLLAQLGIVGVRYNLALTAIVSAQDGVPGVVCTRSLDANDRPIAFAYAGTKLFADGATVPAAALQLRKSVNFVVAAAGLAYATFYETFEPETMDVFRKAIGAARRAHRGLWALDATGGFEFRDTGTIQDDVVILPKLFRRLVGFLLNHSDFAELSGFLSTLGDRVLVIGESGRRNLRDLIQVDGRRLALKVNPEDLIFEPKG